MTDKDLWRIEPTKVLTKAECWVCGAVYMVMVDARKIIEEGGWFSWLVDFPHQIECPDCGCKTAETELSKIAQGLTNHFKKDGLV